MAFTLSPEEKIEVEASLRDTSKHINFMLAVLHAAGSGPLGEENRVRQLRHYAGLAMDEFTRAIKVIEVRQ